MIAVGERAETPLALPEVVAGHPMFERHLGTPWLVRKLVQYYGVTLAGGTVGPAGFSEDALSLHSFLLGATRMGKTRLLFHLAKAQLELGCSIVAIDPKEETILHLAEAARRAGIPEERIVAVLPNRKRAPGWNPLIGPDAAHSAKDVAGIVWAVAQGSGSEKGPQMTVALAHSLALIAAHGLSLLELVAVLRDKAYREYLLSLPAPAGRNIAIEEAREYFQSEYSPAWAASVTNKLFTVFDSDYLRAMVCAESNSIDLPSLWREPGAVLIHAAPDAGDLGEDGALFLAGMAAWSVARTAGRVGHPDSVPVVLGLDEVGLGHGMLAGALTTIITIAAERNVRLCAAAQFLDLLPLTLRRGLLTSGAFSFFRLNRTDAGEIARLLGENDIPSLPARVSVEPDRLTKAGADLSVERFTLCDAYTAPAQTSPASWEAVQRRVEWNVSPDDKLKWCEILMRTSAIPGNQLHVRLDDGGYRPLRSFVSPLQEGEWRIEGPKPLQVAISFPRPAFGTLPGGPSRTEGWERRLAELQRRQAVLYEPGAGPAVQVTVAEVPALAPSPAFLTALLRKGTSQEEANAAYLNRRSAIRAAAGKSSSPPGAAAARQKKADVPLAPPTPLRAEDVADRTGPAVIPLFGDDE